MLRNRNLKVIIFDLDGTLLNTKEGILKSLEEILANNGLPAIPERDKRKFIGPPMAASLEKYFNLEKDYAKKLAMDFRDLYAGENSLCASRYKGLCKTLKFLRILGYKLCVATYKREDVAIKVLDHFNLSKYFDYIGGTDHDGTLTKTDLLKNAIEAVGCKPKNAVMVGDTRGDGLAAKEVGCKFIAVKYGFGFNSEEELADLKPIAVCKSVNEIYDCCKIARKQ